MARTTDTNNAEAQVVDYRHGKAKRKNNPPAGLAAQGKIADRPAVHYSYDPHRPPVLRFDPSGAPDHLPPLLEEARQRPLTADEVDLLAQALRREEPWLEWAGKREKQKTGFAVDDVPLHIHERVSAKAILAVAARQDIQRDMFADPQQEYHEAVRFYQHDVDWANRLILGDSLVVMTSLAKREDLAGKVQMIYLDPPYGIRFASNFQPQVGQRNVADKAQDLTREPEVVKAYRDTWTLGVHSYLAYLRDRFHAAKQLLADSGSIFVQIGDENVHVVRNLLDEVFGRQNFCCLLTVQKTSAPTNKYVPTIADFILWYGKDASVTKYHQLFQAKGVSEQGGSQYTWLEMPTGEEKRLTKGERDQPTVIPDDARVFAASDASSSHEYSLGKEPVQFSGRSFTPGGRYWSTSPEGMARARDAYRLIVTGNTLFYKRLLDDFPVYPLANIWTDTSSSFGERVYVVQTTTKVIERCMLMTTDPGDLVLDPTCGSGTTAYVAEQWGRRWITIDSSRVAVAIARQRLLTAAYEYYKLRDPEAGPAGNFEYRSVPHVTLKSIAQNTALDPIFARHAPLLEKKLSALNAALAGVSKETRAALAAKLAAKELSQGKRSLTEADRRRWLLPKLSWQDWEVPYDDDPDWPQELQTVLSSYRAAWRAKMDAVNACIAAAAESKDLVDQPKVERRVTRVCGPFTVEAVLPPVVGLEPESSPVDELDEELPTFTAQGEPANAAAYVERMRRLLAQDGVRFPDNKQMQFARLDPLAGSVLQAEGEWASESGNGGARRVAVAFGPQYGPVTARQVEECLRTANRLSFDDLVFAAFSFDAAAQAAIQEGEYPHVRPHLAHIRPDVSLGGLLKETLKSQLFTVFGLPRTSLVQGDEDQWRVAMEGVDVYDPVNNVTIPTGADKVAAWFVDSDYDGRTFCICQAFFPDKSAWEKLARALKSVVDESAFAQLSGTVSLPFPVGKHKRVAVKVIDPRGNEVLRVHSLAAETTYA